MADVTLETLAEARKLLTAADHVLTDLRMPEPELTDAISRMRWAHGLLWDLSRKYAVRAGAEVRNDG